MLFRPLAYRAITLLFFFREYSAARGLFQSSNGPRYCTYANATQKIQMKTIAINFRRALSGRFASLSNHQSCTYVVNSHSHYLSHTVSTGTCGNSTSMYLSWLHTQGVIGMTATVPLARNLASQSHGGGSRVVFWG